MRREELVTAAVRNVVRCDDLRHLAMTLGMGPRFQLRGGFTELYIEEIRSEFKRLVAA